MNEEVKKLIKQETEIRKRRMEAEDKFRRKELKPILRKQIGKCFKFRNSYGGDYERWWLYEKIISLTAEGYFYCEKFQEDCNGEIEIKYVEEFNYNKSHFDDTSWTEIPVQEYNEAKQNIIDKLQEKGFLV